MIPHTVLIVFIVHTVVQRIVPGDHVVLHSPGVLEEHRLLVLRDEISEGPVIVMVLIGWT